MAASGGKWGYLVVFASFLVHMVACGIAYSCGAFYLRFLAEFKEGQFKSAWTGALMLAMIPIAGIPSTVIVYRLGARASVILGGLLAALGFGLASFASRVWQTYTTLGIMTGAGFGFALTPSILILGDYYPGNTELPVNFALSGVGLGMTFFPVVIQHLLDAYEWQTVFYILAGMCGSIIIAGVLMRPVRNSDKSYSKRDVLKIFEPSLCNCIPFVMLCLSNFIWSFGLSALYHQLPEYAQNVGGWGKDAMILIAVVGISSFSSRAVFQLFSHSAKLDHISIFLCTIGLTAILTGLFPELFKYKSGQIGYAILLGLHVGFWSTFMSHISMEIIGSSYLAFGKGFIYLSLGVGLLLGAPVAALIYELESDYDIGFYLAGSCLLAPSIIMTGVNLGGNSYHQRLSNQIQMMNNTQKSLIANDTDVAEQMEETEETEEADREEISTQV